MTKNLLLWVVIGLVALTLFTNFTSSPDPEEISYTAFVEEVENSKVREQAALRHTERWYDVQSSEDRDSGSTDT